MRISDIKATTVTVPLEAPLRHAAGVHWGRFVRTIVQVFTDEGLVGLGEMGGGGESAEAAIESMKQYLLGHDPFQLEALRWKIMNPTASLYNNRTQIHAALEFACIDIMGKATGKRACDLFGGALRERVPFASYLFFRYPDKQTAKGGEETADQMIAHARDLVAKYGFTTHKLKGGVFDPKYEIEVYRALAQTFPDHKMRFDPNGLWSVEEAIWAAGKIADLNNDYLEDPTWGLAGMTRVRERISIPTATNQVVVNFEQLASCILHNAVDVILLDTTFWGGLRQAIKAGHVCETFQWGIAVHSSGELGIQLATMLHLGAVLPNQRFAGDAHYHHLTDDIIKGGKMTYENGSIAVPTAPGLGIELDEDKFQQYAELYRELGGYQYDRDPYRPDWYAIQPGRDYAVPSSR
jgi:glucarate dehydratase